MTQERRGHPRGYVAAIATVFVQGRRVGEYAVRDLSAGGAFLADGPPLPLGTSLGITMRMSGLGSLKLSALALHARDHRGIGIRFLGLPPEVADGLEDLVRQELARLSEPSVLVASGSLELLALVADQLAAIGERPLLARTSLEVVHWMSDPNTTVARVLVCGDLRTTAAQELADFVGREFPDVECHLLEENTPEDELRRLLDEGPGALSGARTRSSCSA
jgi:hypothetical protein